MCLKKIYTFILSCITVISLYSAPESTQKRLIRAVMQNDIAAVRDVLQHKENSENQTKGNFNVMDDAFFLCHEPCFFAIDPLSHAIQCGYLDIAQLLVRSGIHTSQSQNRTLLGRGINQGNTELIQLIIQMGTDINQQNRKGNTPLFDAIERDNTKIIPILIKAGADLEKPCSNGWTPLLSAIILKKPRIAGMLLHFGADTNHASTDGVTPLSEAIIQKNKTMVQLLVRAGAHVNSNDRRGWASVFNKLGNPDCCFIAEYLLSVGAQLGDWTTNLGQQSKKRLVVMAKTAIKIRAEVTQQCFHTQAETHFPNVLQALIGDFEDTPISSKQAQIAQERVRKYCV